MYVHLSTYTYVLVLHVHAAELKRLLLKLQICAKNDNIGKVNE